MSGLDSLLALPPPREGAASVDRLRIAALEAELQHKGAALKEAARARRSLQAEVTDAQSFVDGAASELVVLRRRYQELGHVLAATKAEAGKLRESLERAGVELAEQRTALVEQATREREALRRGHEAHVVTLEEGWAAQRARLERELAQATAARNEEQAQYRARAAAEDSASRLERERLQREAEDARSEAARGERAAEEMRAAHATARTQLVELSAALEQAQRERDAERAQRLRVEEWARQAHVRLQQHERRAHEASRVAQLAQDSAADALRAEAMRAYEAHAALAEVKGRAEASSHLRELQHSAHVQLGLPLAGLR